MNHNNEVGYLDSSLHGLRVVLCSSVRFLCSVSTVHFVCHAHNSSAERAASVHKRNVHVFEHSADTLRHQLVKQFRVHLKQPRLGAKKSFLLFSENARRKRDDRFQCGGSTRILRQVYCGKQNYRRSHLQKKFFFILFH